MKNKLIEDTSLTSQKIPCPESLPFYLLLQQINNNKYLMGLCASKQDSKRGAKKGDSREKNKLENKQILEYVDKFFKTYDLNNDGKVEVEQIKKVFMDRAARGEKQLDESEMNLRITVFLKADHDGNRQVTKEELLNHLIKCNQELAK